MSEPRAPRAWVQTTLVTAGVLAVSVAAVIVGFATGPDPADLTTPVHIIGTPLEGSDHGNHH